MHIEINSIFAFCVLKRLHTYFKGCFHCLYIRKNFVEQEQKTFNKKYKIKTHSIKLFSFYLLMNLFSFILELPDRFRLVPYILPHGNGLDGAKICSLDPCVLWTGVKRVKRGISVKILIASIPNTVRVIISLYKYIVIILHFAKIVFYICYINCLNI